MYNEKTEVCGTCRYHQKLDDWVCGNPDSDMYGDYTDYRCSCEYWEVRGHDRDSGFCI